MTSRPAIPGIDYLSSHARKATLEGFRIIFNKPSDVNGGSEGWPNIVVDVNRKVCGVLYKLPTDSFEHYASHAEKGYRKETIKVLMDGKEDNKVDAVTFVAKDTRDNIPPSKERYFLMVKGAGSHKLEQEYIDELKSTVGIEIPGLGNG